MLFIIKYIDHQFKEHEVNAKNFPHVIHKNDFTA